MKDGHFIKHIEIHQFRCFERLKVDHLKRVNLIGGDNNVGKTAFLEALEIVSETRNPLSLVEVLRHIIQRRQSYHPGNRDLDLIGYGGDHFKLDSDGMSLSLAVKENVSMTDFDDIGPGSGSSIPEASGFPGTESNRRDQEMDQSRFVEMKVNGYEQGISRGRLIRMINSPDRFSKLDENMDFIASDASGEIKLSSLYGAIVDLGKTRAIDKFLKEFDPRIKSLAVRPTETRSVVFKMNLEDRKEPVFLSSMGGGLTRYIAMVCAIWKCAGGRLFIDEIENGIHHEKYERLWEIIFKTSREANCQVFVTTHSKECIEAFAGAAERHDPDRIQYLNFSRDVDHPGKIVATALEPAALFDYFDQGLDVR
jgi:hypothetical protein